jgi:hypothetical protein
MFSMKKLVMELPPEQQAQTSPLPAENQQVNLLSQWSNDELTTPPLPSIVVTQSQNNPTPPTTPLSITNCLVSSQQSSNDSGNFILLLLHPRHLNVYPSLIIRRF